MAGTKVPAIVIGKLPVSMVLPVEMLRVLFWSLSGALSTIH